jgi:hypothetical protein
VLPITGDSKLAPRAIVNGNTPVNGSTTT